MRLRTKIILALSAIILILCIGLGGLFYTLFYRTPGDYFESNGARVYYTVQGEGEPVILVHGIGANADLNWQRPGVIRALAKDFKVIAFDLRGHGLTDKPVDSEQYGLRMAEDIVLLMDHLGYERAHLAGYSLGGFLALKAATLYPDRIASLAVCAAGWIDPANPIEVPSPYRPPVPTNQLQVSQAAVLPLFAASKSVFHRIRSAVGDHFMDPKVKKALKATYEELAVPREDLLALELPMLSIIGKKDGFLYIARDLVALKPDIESFEVDNYGHFSLPFNREFKEHLRAFFRKHPIQEPAAP
jgi:pimeloyl-ACP methyl ester carboxylesterase